MGVLSFILGRSGTGKTSSLRNFPKDKVAIINVQGKILPFKGSGAIEQTVTDQSDKIVKALQIYSKTYKSIVIDDYQYTMANEFMRRSTERGYDKFTEIGRHAWDIANAVRELPSDVIVYVMCHTDRDDEGNEKIKTIGKLLDEKICLEGMSTIVLKTNVTDGQYSFLTQNNGKDTVKSPAGMFPSYAIDNDLYYVDQKIRSYYELGEHLTEAEMQEIDEAAKKDDIPIREPGEKKSRKRAKAEDTPEEQPTQRRKRASIKEEKEAVDAENLKAVLNANADDEREEIPIEETKEPELKETPRRKRRESSNEEPKTEPMNAPVEESNEEKVETTPSRRRRRRAE